MKLDALTVLAEKCCEALMTSRLHIQVLLGKLSMWIRSQYLLEAAE
jgi:hypothetical protein